MEKNLKKYITELLCCVPETNTISSIYYTSIKQKPTVRYPYTYTVRVKTNKQTEIPDKVSVRMWSNWNSHTQLFEHKLFI